MFYPELKEKTYFTADCYYDSREGIFYKTGKQDGRDEHNELDPNIAHLLECLILNKNIYIKSDSLIEEIYRFNTPDSPGAALSTCISKLRKVLKDIDSEIKVENKYGVGYRLILPDISPDKSPVPDIRKSGKAARELLIAAWKEFSDQDEAFTENLEAQDSYLDSLTPSEAPADPREYFYLTCLAANVAACYHYIGQRNRSIHDAKLAYECISLIPGSYIATLSQEDLHFYIGSLNHIAYSLSYRGQINELMIGYDSAVRGLALLSPNCERSELPLYVKLLTNMGSIELFRNHLDDAEEAYRKALEIKEAMARENPTDPYLERNVGIAYRLMGILYFYRAKIEETEANLIQSLVCHKKAVEKLQSFLSSYNTTYDFAIAVKYKAGALLELMKITGCREDLPGLDLRAEFEQTILDMHESLLKLLETEKADDAVHNAAQILYELVKYAKDRAPHFLTGVVSAICKDIAAHLRTASESDASLVLEYARLESLLLR